MIFNAEGKYGPDFQRCFRTVLPPFLLIHRHTADGHGQATQQKQQATTTFRFLFNFVVFIRPAPCRPRSVRFDPCSRAWLRSPRFCGEARYRARCLAHPIADVDRSNSVPRSVLRRRCPLHGSCLTKFLEAVARRRERISCPIFVGRT